MKTKFGECRCGCEVKTKISKCDFRKWGGPGKGEPNFYLPGHQRRKPRKKLKQPTNPKIRLIALTHGHIAIVDRNMYEQFCGFTWMARKEDLDGKGIYAMRQFRKNGKLFTIRMHNEVLRPRDGFLADHKNGDKLDNRRCNLREADATQNGINKNIFKNNRSGCKDVHQRGDNGRWRARLSFRGIRYDLGTFSAKKQAVSARRAKERELHAEFTFKVSRQRDFRSSGLEP